MTLRFVLLAMAGLADLSLVTLFALVRTDAPLQSPWQLLSPLVFVVFALSTAALWLAAGEKQDRWLMVGLCFHAFTAVSVSAIVYTLGFGFDPLLHQAAEIDWQRNGIPNPLSLLYSGQYAIVSSVASLTGLSVLTIDRWLVPLLSSLTPLIVTAGLRSAWQVPRQLAPRSAFALFLVPFAPLSFTIPYHLGVVLFLWITAWLPATRLRTRVLLLCLSAAALTIHPLIGLPAIVLVVGHEIIRHFKPVWLRRIGLLLFFCFMVFTLPVAFLWLYRSQLDQVVDWSGLLRPTIWFALFRDPYPFAGWGWEAFYLFRQTLPLFCAAIAGVVAWRTWPELRRSSGLLMLFLLGLLGSTFLLTSLFRYPDIISSEQYEFPLRLIQLLPLATFPFLAIGLLQAQLRLTSPAARALLCVCVGAATSLAWFFSYPQMNAKAHWSGPSAGAADAATVRQIEVHASGTPHIVLSPPITAALAVRTYGFREVPGGMLWYPLPTGGVLFPYFLRLSHAPDAVLATEAARHAGVHRVYVVHDRSVLSTPSTIRIDPYGILVDIYDTP